MKDDLNKVTEAVHLGRHTLRIMQTNIISGLAIKTLFLVLALFGGRFSLIRELLSRDGTLLNRRMLTNEMAAAAIIKSILFRSKTGALRLHIGFSKITLFPG